MRLGWKRKLGIGAALLLAGAGVALAWLPGKLEAEMNPVRGGPWKVSEAARDLLSGLVVADLHSDALLWGRDLSQRGTRGHVDLPRLVEGRVAFQVFTAVTRSPRGQNYESNPADAADNITALFMAQGRPVRTWNSLAERALHQGEALVALEQDGVFRIIRSRADLAELVAARRTGGNLVGGLLGIEGAHALEGKLETLDRLEDAGFRLIGLMHFFDNELGGSLHGSRDMGLTPFGRQVVEELIKRRMVIDLAHASPQVVRDVLDMPGAVPIISHTGIASHCKSARNLSDALVKAVADKGGLIGIGFWRGAVCGGTPDDIAGAIMAAVALVGADHVALGSDYDGAVGVPFDVSGMAVLVQALLDRGMDRATIAKVMGENQIDWFAAHLP